MWRTGINGSIILALTLCLSTVHIGWADDCSAAPCQDWYEDKCCDNHPSCVNRECVACAVAGGTCSSEKPCCESGGLYCNGNAVCSPCIAHGVTCGTTTVPCCEPFSCFPDTGAVRTCTCAAVGAECGGTSNPECCSPFKSVRTALLNMMLVETITSLAVMVLPALKTLVKPVLHTMIPVETMTRTAAKVRSASVVLVWIALMRVMIVVSTSIRTAAQVLPAFIELVRTLLVSFALKWDYHVETISRTAATVV